MRGGGQGPLVVPSGAKKLKLATAALKRSLKQKLQDASWREVTSRKWTKGAVIRRMGKGGIAEKAGCLAGDIILSANGHDMLNASTAEVVSMMSLKEPLTLEVAQPLLSDPLYLEEASLTLLEIVAGARTRELRSIFARVQELFSQHMALENEVPLVFAGDGGSASHVHTDKNPQLQMCHVLHGAKLFGVAHEPGAASVPWIRRFGEDSDVEVSLPADKAPTPEQAEWLSSSGMSVAMGRAGDILVFWGGTSLWQQRHGVGSMCVNLSFLQATLRCGGRYSQR
eukprot:TRINITY_DN43124_c0_g1_i1.p1 TRINITY_DN43124_c0_g1~~TRINITY_DN43124_c0_g1_i1.p1  ORF type:complete len:292 (+),score=46.90 TRINITY_DN43124_c0_g1_i1:29-877(+)